MTKKTEEMLREARDSDKTVEEAIESQKETNSRVDWDIREMLPGVARDNE